MRLTTSSFGFILLIGAGAAMAAPPAAPTSVSAPNATSAPVITVAPATQLNPEPRQVLIGRTVVQVMQAQHYPAKALDETLSQSVLKQYFDSLDPGHFYLTRPMVDRFLKDDASLADDLKHGNLKPAFAIYDDYIAQVHRQIHYALSLLANKPTLASAASFRFDRRHAPWAADQDALDTLWRQRVSNDVIGLLLAGKSWKEAKSTLTKRYLYALNHVNQTTSDDVFDSWMNAYAQAEDPHSSYFSPFDAQQFQIQMSLQLEGIGAQLTERNNYVTVVRILPGGPAAKSSVLKAGDRIVAVGEGQKGKLTDVIGWRLDDVVKKIRGPKGSTVRLKILPAGALPGGAEKIISLVRNTIELNAEHAHAQVALVKHGAVAYKIGVITIPSFYVNFQAEGDGDRQYTSVSRDVAALVKALEQKHVSGILLDLRDNGGGSLQEARALTGLFIPGGPVVQVQDRHGHTEVLATPRGEKPVWLGPLAVLINRFSASATEIFTGAMKDYHRALILGSDTWGKGTVQQLMRLDRYLPGFKAGELKLTTAQFFRVNGSSTQSRGIEPDIKLPTAINKDKFGESSYPNALPWKQIDPAQYTPLQDGLSTLLPKIKAWYRNVLQKRSRFQLYLRQTRELRTQAARTEISLDLAKRKTERANRRARELGLDNAWRKLQGKPPFKSLKAVDDANFSPPDMALTASMSLLGEYIDLAPSVSVTFKRQIHALNPNQSEASSKVSCLHSIGRNAWVGFCPDGKGGKARIIYPPSAQTGTSSDGGAP